MPHPKGYVPWNKGKRQKFNCADCDKNISYHSKRCRKCLDKFRTGENNNLWLGDNVGYSGIHIWINQKFGKANRCENFNCIVVKPKRYEWALIKGKKYERKRENFWMLCTSCHRKYDMTEKIRINLSKAQKRRFKKETVWNKGIKQNEYRRIT